MIKLNPADRCSAELYLDEEKNKIFPDYFYSFLQPYLQMFSATNPIISPDEKIDRWATKNSMFKLKLNYST